MKFTAKWIKPARNLGYIAPLFSREFDVKKGVKKATLYISARGVYEASINGRRVGKFILAPGWTAYEKRLQYQEYDVTELLCEHNRISVYVGHGWYYIKYRGENELMDKPCGLFAELCIEYADGTTETVVTDESWTADEGKIRRAQIYDGEIYDESIKIQHKEHAVLMDESLDALVPQVGPMVREQEEVSAVDVFRTPKGELVVDFGQNLTGYVRTSIADAKLGDILDISYAEVLDKHGNFYNENYINALCLYRYTCCDGAQEYKPHLTFCGFRYIKINEFPRGLDKVDKNTFKAVVVHSDMKRTGYIETSAPLLNQLFSNVIWSQRSNFLDIPSDCPQRNERLGWTGDAQVFTRAACYNFDCEQFFAKWLCDVRAEQGENGYIPNVVPDVHNSGRASAAWGDVITTCPWEVYLAYGDKRILADCFDAMKRWVDFAGTTFTPDYMLTKFFYEASYGDWLALDTSEENRRGASRRELISLAFYYYSATILVKSGKILGYDIKKYEALSDELKAVFREKFKSYETQTECALALRFGLAEDKKATADKLAEIIKKAGRLETGFVGTPHLLHALADNGHAELAYTLLLRTEYPSWLYPVTKGATTIWEHWDGIKPNGDFWAVDMNSYNHYAFGSVADWIYGFVAGITPVEDAPGYERVKISPHTDQRLDFVRCSLDTRHGTVKSEWKKTGGGWQYNITTPVRAEILIGEKQYTVDAGSYEFYN